MKASFELGESNCGTAADLRPDFFASAYEMVGKPDDQDRGTDKSAQTTECKEEKAKDSDYESDEQRLGFLRSQPHLTPDQQREFSILNSAQGNKFAQCLVAKQQNGTITDAENTKLQRLQTIMAAAHDPKYTDFIQAQSQTGPISESKMAEYRAQAKSDFPDSMENQQLELDFLTGKISDPVELMQFLDLKTGHDFPNDPGGRELEESWYLNGGKLEADEQAQLGLHFRCFGDPDLVDLEQRDEDGILEDDEKLHMYQLQAKYIYANDPDKQAQYVDLKMHPVPVNKTSQSTDSFWLSLSPFAGISGNTFGSEGQIDPSPDANCHYDEGCAPVVPYQPVVDTVEPDLQANWHPSEDQSSVSVVPYQDPATATVPIPDANCHYDDGCIGTVAYVDPENAAPDPTANYHPRQDNSPAVTYIDPLSTTSPAPDANYREQPSTTPAVPYVNPESTSLPAPDANYREQPSSTPAVPYVDPESAPLPAPDANNHPEPETSSSSSSPQP